MDLQSKWLKSLFGIAVGDSYSKWICEKVHWPDFQGVFWFTQSPLSNKFLYLQAQFNKLIWTNMFVTLVVDQRVWSTLSWTFFKMVLVVSCWWGFGTIRTFQEIPDISATSDKIQEMFWSSTPTFSLTTKNTNFSHSFQFSWPRKPAIQHS